jgi:hypothetical protein
MLHPEWAGASNGLSTPEAASPSRIKVPEQERSLPRANKSQVGTLENAHGNEPELDDGPDLM